jgi:hypothetical protein
MQADKTEPTSIYTLLQNASKNMEIYKEMEFLLCWRRKVPWWHTAKVVATVPGQFQLAEYVQDDFNPLEKEHGSILINFLNW